MLMGTRTKLLSVFAKIHEIVRFQWLSKTNKSRSLLKIWQQSVDGWLLTEAEEDFQVKRRETYKVKNLLTHGRILSYLIYSMTVKIEIRQENMSLRSLIIITWIFWINFFLPFAANEWIFENGISKHLAKQTIIHKAELSWQIPKIYFRFFILFEKFLVSLGDPSNTVSVDILCFTQLIIYFHEKCIVKHFN